jgi:RNase adapter protein RapZ
MTGARRRIVLVTGLSGSGKSSVLRELEDLGYETVDNPPLPMLEEMVRRSDRNLAIGVDARTRGFDAEQVLKALARLRVNPELQPELIYTTADETTLLRRYTETRRRHPLALERPVADGIRLERQRIWPLRGRADLIIDSSALTPSDLKRVLQGHFALDDAPGIAIFVTSFAYRHGLPRDADLVFDVRFLRNPHYVDALRARDGRDADVGAYIEQDANFHRLFDRLCAWVEDVLPCYEREGRSYVTIAIGCTGGRHRSVFSAERLAAWLRRKGRRVEVAHRDVDRTAEPTAELARTPAQPVKDIA